MSAHLSRLSRTALALASLGFVASAWIAPATAVAQQRGAPAANADVTVSGSAIGAGARASRAKYGGTTCQWDGSTGNWSQAAKWSCGHVPQFEDEVTVSDGVVTLDVGTRTLRLGISGGVFVVQSDVSIEGPVFQTGGQIRLTQDANLRFPRGDLFRQEAGTIIFEFGGLTRFARMNFDNGIGGIGLYAFAGTMHLATVNGYVPNELDQFQVIVGSNVGNAPAVTHGGMPRDFFPVLGQFAGVVKSLNPGACRWIGGYSVWDNPANWSCGHVPGTTDTATIDNAQIEMRGDRTVGRLISRGNARLYGFGSTLRALGAPQPNQLESTLTLAQEITLALGDTSVTGTLQVDVSASTVVNEGRFAFQERSGSVLQTGASFALQFGTLRNAPGATMYLKGRGALQVYGGAGTVENFGSLELVGIDPLSPFLLDIQPPVAFRQMEGATILQGAFAPAFDPPAVLEIMGGELMGFGSFPLAVRNIGGAVRPGVPGCGGGEAAAAAPASAKVTSAATCTGIGAFTFASYDQGPGGTLELQVGGGSQGQRDEIGVEGPAQLAGTLEVKALNGYVPDGDIQLLGASGPITGTFGMVVNEYAPAFTVVYDPLFGVMLRSLVPPTLIAPAITSTQPPTNAKVGVAYNHRFTATGSPTPAFGIGSGALPTGLSLAIDGTLAGTPSSIGTFTATALATNGVVPDALQAFSITVAAGDPASIVAQGSGSQSAVAGNAFSQPLTVLVRDAGGNALPGIAVTFSAPAAGASATFSKDSYTTDASGLASATATANDIAGSYVATASIPGVPGAATFELTNLAGAQAATLGVSFSSNTQYGLPQAFTARATFGPDAQPVPEGIVRVTVDDVEACRVTLPETQCVAELPIEPGSRFVRAYLDSPAFTAPTFASVMFVQPRQGSLTIAAPTNATIGTSITANVTLRYFDSPEDMGPGTAVPGGVLTIRRGATEIVCQAAVASVDFTLPCTIPVTGSQIFTVRAEYLGDARYAAASTFQVVVPTNAGEGYNVGDIVPNFTVHDHLGNVRSLREFAGKHVLLDFCTAWCTHCQTMGYDAGRIRETFGGQPFEYLTVVLESPEIGSPSSIADAREWFSEHPVFGPVLHLNGEADPNFQRDVNRFFYGMFASPAYPTLVVLDPTQRLLHKSQGERDAAGLASLIAGSMGIATPPLAARFRTSPLSVASIDFRSSAASLDAPLVPGGSIGLTAIGSGLTVELGSASINRQPYDETTSLLITRATPFTPGKPIQIALKSLAFGDGFARQVYSAELYLDGVPTPLAGAAITGATLTLPPITLTAANITQLRIELLLDVDFLNNAPTAGTPPAITSAAPSGGQVGVAYSHSYVATGTAPIAFTLASGALPPGLTLSTAGALTGTPTTAGTFTGSVRATGGEPPAATQGFSIAIAAAVPAEIRALGGDNQSAQLGAAFAVPLSVLVLDASGNPLSGVPVTFLAPAGGPGVSFAPVTAVTGGNGQASTTATAGAAAGTYIVMAIVADVAMPASFRLTNVDNRPEVALNITLAGSGQGTAGGCTATCQQLVRAGTSVTLTATPLAGSVFSGWSGACSGTGNCSLVVNAATTVVATFAPAPVAPVITSSKPPAGVSGRAYQHRFVATGTTPIAYSLTSGALPPGLRLDSDGSLAGTPTTAGAFTATVTAANGTAPDATQSFTISIAPGILAQLVIVSGNFQVAGFDPAGRDTQAFAQALRVRVMDASGNGIGGQTISYIPMTLAGNAVAPTAVLSALTTTTDALGFASVTATAAGGMGSFRVRARLEVDDAPPAVFFDLTNHRTDLARPFKLRFEFGAGQRQPILAPYAPLRVTALDANNRGVPGLEVRFFAPTAPATASVRFESGIPGPGYHSIVTGDGGAGQVNAIANGIAGEFTVSAVLVEEGQPNDPASLAGNPRRFDFGLSNVTNPVTMRIVHGNNQRQAARQTFGEPLIVQMAGPGSGDERIQDVEIWFFADDEAAGLAGATIVAPTAISGQLANGRRYTSILSNNGGATVTAIANRFRGAHRVIVAYPGAYQNPEDSIAFVRFSLENTTGDSPTNFNPAPVIPARISLASGNFQVARFANSGTNAPFAFPLVVRATDANGLPVAQALVRFAPTALAFDDRDRLVASANLSAATVVTDANGFASVTATPTGRIGQYTVRASVDGVEQEVLFTLTNVNSDLSDVRMHSVFRTGGGLVGDRQLQTVFARFDEALSVTVTNFFGGATTEGREVRFYFEHAEDANGVAAIEPENGTPGVFVRANSSDTRFTHYRSVLVRLGEGAKLTGLANAVPGSYEVIAVLADASADNDNDPLALRNAANRILTFHLENVEKGPVLERISGSDQSQAEGLRFVQPLRVRVGTSLSTTPVGPPSARQFLDGAEVWFITPVPEEKVAGASLLPGDDFPLAQTETGRKFRVIAAAVDDQGFAQVTAVANATQGSHRVIVAYPGNYDDPAKAPFKTDFLLCNAVSAGSVCGDLPKPASIRRADDRDLFTDAETSPPLRVIVSDKNGQPVASVPVTFTIANDRRDVGISAASGWSQSGPITRVAFTDSQGMADGATGLQLLRVNTEYRISASVPGVSSVALVVTRYGQPTTFAAAGALGSTARIGTAHAAMQVTMNVATSIRWTIEPGANGAGGTFANGTNSLTSFPAVGAGDRLVSAVVTANQVAGRFVLRAQAGGSLPEVRFFLTNLPDPPAAIERADAGLLFTFTSAPPAMRALARDANGQPMAGVPITFVLTEGASSADGNSLWTRNAQNRFERTVATDAAGIANGATGLTFRDANTRYTLVASAQGLATTLSLSAVRYNSPTSLVAAGALASAATVGTQHQVLRATVNARAPVQWTVVPGPNGASATFADGTTTLIADPGPLGGSFTTAAQVRANGMTGTFTLKAEVLRTSIPPVIFAMTNLAMPASIERADTGPLFTYSSSPPAMRAIVKDASGQPIAGVPVTFVIGLGGVDAASNSGWARNAQNRNERTVVTGADGIASGAVGLSFRDSRREYELVATAQGLATTLSMRAIRYDLPSTFAPTGVLASAAVVGTAHRSLQVAANTQAVVQWTIVPGPSGASATFPNGTTNFVDAGSDRVGAFPSSATVTANSIPGNFTLKAEVLRAGNLAPVTFAMTNLAAAPAAIERADTGPLFTYSSSPPAMRAIVKDASGRPIAGVPVTFVIGLGGVDAASNSGWARNAQNRNERTVVTGADGIASGAVGLSFRDSRLEYELVATAQGLATTLSLRAIRYDLPSTFAPTGALASAAAVGTAHRSLQVTANTQSVVQWTIVPGPSGASATFPNGTTTLVAAGSDRVGAFSSSATVTANTIPGTFTLKAEVLRAGNLAPVTFAMTNLAAAPAAIERADTGPLFTYSSSPPAMRAIVKDASGRPIAGVPVTFVIGLGGVDTASNSGWVRNAQNRNERTVVTGADGIASGAVGLGFRDSRREYELVATAQNLATTLTLRAIRYDLPSTFAPTGALASTAAVGTAHQSLQVTANTQAVVQWTIVPGPSGASATFPNGSTTLVAAGSDRVGAFSSSATVTANNIPGTFTLKAEVLRAGNLAPVTFAMRNVAPQ